MSLIASTEVFQNMDEMMVEGIVSDDRCFQKSFEKGQIIFDEENYVPCLGIVLSGGVKIEKLTGGSRRVKLSQLAPGGCFGAAAMFQSIKRYPTKITAVEKTEILFLPEEVLLWFMQRSPVLMENYIRFLSQRIRFLNTKIATLSVGNAQQRLAMYLLEQGEVNVTMSELSQTLNIGRATLYRCLDALEQQRLICRDNRAVKVMDASGLQRILE